MNLQEQRSAVLAALAKAKKHHRSTAELQRKLNIITAGIMAEQIAAEREKTKQALPPQAFELCSEADPELWSLFCQTENRPPDPSHVWTIFDVVMLLTQKRLQWALAGEMTSRVAH